MKKIVMVAALAVALVSCQSKGNKNASTDGWAADTVPVEEIYEVYEGTLPAADGPGIDYVLTLNAEVVGSDTIFTLDMTFLDAEGPGRHLTYTRQGKQEKVHRVVDKHPKQAYKLTPDNGEQPMYFVIVNDTTLRLVNDSLVESTTNLNYDIIRAE